MCWDWQDLGNHCFKSGPPEEEPKGTVVSGFWFPSTAPSKPSDQGPKSRGHLQDRLLTQLVLSPLGSGICSAGVVSPWLNFSRVTQIAQGELSVNRVTQIARGELSKAVTMVALEWVVASLPPSAPRSGEGQV